MKVIKRNGDLVEFDYSKIIKALKAAYAESNIPFEVLPEHEETLVKAILKTDSDTLNVEDIQDLVEQWRNHISANLYNCTIEIFRGLALMYVADERFTKNIDKYGEGLAQFMSDAMNIYCDNNG